MFWSRAPRAGVQAGRDLYAVAAAQARRPELYTALGASDTPNGRFEVYSLHVILLLNRLKGRGDHAAETAQALFDAYVSTLDDALREQGVGDLSMGKKMRRLGEAFYGRVRSYHTALEALPDRGPLEDLLGRTVLAESRAPGGPLADYADRSAAHLAALPDDDVLAGRASWPEAAA
ncbi:MAG TPA: ubiquinol-cytochrome C chaperone family protein [Caulobacteraceae bacterium]|jgi:cytochrome b pre-mRNA-processing protein 3